MTEPPTEGSINECIRQIALADRIILNKTDLVAPNEINHLMQDISSVNAIAPIHSTVKSRAPLDFLLAIDCYNSIDAVDLEKFKSQQTHKIDMTISTVLLIHPGKLASEKIAHDFVKEVLWENSNRHEVLRMKGILGFKGSDKKHILQSVREMYDVVETQDKIHNEEKWENKFVLIGKGLDRNWVIEALKKCVESYKNE